jgi:hypothetical protein
MSYRTSVDFRRRLFIRTTTGRLVKAEARGKFVEPSEDAQVLAREYIVTFDEATSPSDVARVAQ